MRVDTQYLRLSVRVSSLAVIDTAPRPHSGRQVLATLSAARVAAAPAVGQMVLSFASPQSFVRLFLAGRAQTRGRLFGTVEALDAAGARVAIDGPRAVDPRAAIVGFTLATKGTRISLVRIAVVDSTPNGVRSAAAAIDDLEFGMAAPPTPPPPPPPPPPLVRVPDLHGLAPKEAALRLERAGLRLGAVRDSSTDRFPVNTVVGQVPPPPTRVKPRTLVSVTVARAPAPPPRLPLILAIVAGLAAGGAVAQRAWRRLRWRVGTRAHTGLEALRPRLAAPRESSLEIRLVPVPSSGTQHLRKGP
jgi:hypothetical protein